MQYSKNVLKLELLVLFPLSGAIHLEKYDGFDSTLLGNMKTFFATILQCIVMTISNCQAYQLLHGFFRRFLAKYLFSVFHINYLD